MKDLILHAASSYLMIISRWHMVILDFFRLSGPVVALRMVAPEVLEVPEDREVPLSVIFGRPTITANSGIAANSCTLSLSRVNLQVSFSETSSNTRR